MASPIILVAGARPNFVKIAPLLRAFEARSVETLLVHTGQHYDYVMSGVFFEQLSIRQPDAFLKVGSAAHGAQTAAIMTKFEELLETVTAPRGVVVVGDVNSTMAAALVAAKMRVPVAHVEAGLRSHDRSMPEEINRIVTDAVADVLLVSEPDGIENLRVEGAASRARYVGNVMIDTLIAQLPVARALEPNRTYGLRAGEYAVVTLHRPSNVDDAMQLEQLVTFLERLAHEMPVVFPAHPRTKQRLQAAGMVSDAVRMIEPLGYREFLGLVDSARVVVSDSGGIQEETSYLGIPCVTLRSNTERPVTLVQGTNQLAGNNLELAFTLATQRKPRRPATIEGWDGSAADRVADLLAELWN